MGVSGTTQRMIAVYMERASAPMFLSGFFQSPPRNFHTSEEVTMDIERDDEDVAVVIQSLNTGAHMNEASQFTSKKFKPPIFDEGAAISAFDQMQRRPGVDPFQDPDYVANAVEEAFGIGRKLENKIRRAVELMASQVLRTGKLTLKDKAGADAYVLDFKPKATHFPTAGTAWGSGGYKPLVDLAALAKVVRRDGKDNPNRLVFGERAWTDFLAETDVIAALNMRRGSLIEVAPQVRGQGATFQGWVWIGHYRFEMWTYDGFFRDPATGTVTSYVGQDEVIMLSQGSRLDLTWGAIPLLRAPAQPALSFLPPRMSSAEGLLDLSVNAYFTPDGKRLMVEFGTRPLTIPTGIDTFGCLKTR